MDHHQDVIVTDLKGETNRLPEVKRENRNMTVSLRFLHTFASFCDTFTFFIINI